MIVEYTEGAWSRIHTPERGSVTVYPDGLLNVVDTNGRCMDALHDARTLWLDEDRFFEIHPECKEGAEVVFPDEVREELRRLGFEGETYEEFAARTNPTT